MFPDPSQTTQGASESVTTQVQTAVVSEEQPAQPVTQQPKGSHTPDNQLYAALKDERERRKTLEARLEALESNSQSSVSSYTSDDVYSDEGKIILQQIEPLKKTIDSLQEQLEIKDLMVKYPSLQGKLEEFQAYRQEYPRHKLENVAKLFLSENGLLESAPARQGLESPSGGPKPKESSGTISAEEVDRIMKNQPKLFIKMLREGTLDPDKIK